MAKQPPEDVLELVREGGLDAAGSDLDVVAGAVRAFGTSGQTASALELLARTWRLWLAQGELDTASALIAETLALPGADGVPRWRGRLLYADGLFAFRAGDQERSLARNEDALHAAREAGDVVGECEALTGLARVALRDGRYDRVVQLAEQGRALARAAGDEAAEAAPLHLLAAGVRLQRDYRRARDLYLDSLALNARLGQPAWVAMERHNLGWVELHLGDPDAAAAQFTERDGAAGHDAYGDAWRELNWSAIAEARGELEEATSRFAAGEAALTSLGMALDPDDQFELDWLRHSLQSPQ